MASTASREPRRYPSTSGASPRRPAGAGAAGPGSEGGADAVCPSGGPAAPGRSRGGARPRLGAAGAPDPEPDAAAVERDVDGGDRDLGGLGGAKMGGPDHPPQKGPRPRPRRPHGMATSAAHRGGRGEGRKKPRAESNDRDTTHCTTDLVAAAGHQGPTAGPVLGSEPPSIHATTLGPGAEGPHNRVPPEAQLVVVYHPTPAGPTGGRAE